MDETVLIVLWSRLLQVNALKPVLLLLSASVFPRSASQHL